MTPVTRTLSERLAHYVVGLRFDDLPADVVERTKDHLVHLLGVALRGHGDEVAQQVVGLAYELSGGAGGYTIVGEHDKAAVLDAIFANSWLMCFDNLDDFQLPSGIHPGAVTHPVAWALGERTAASGRELLTAVVAGYDVAIKLANLAWIWGAPNPRRPNSVLGAVGAAATAARLLGLSPAQTADAIGHGANAGMGLVEAAEYMDPPHELLARNGVLGALMAARGMHMTPRIFEGEHGLFRSVLGEVPDRRRIEEEMATLGHRFEIMTSTTKRYRSSGLNIVPIDLALELVRTQQLDRRPLQKVTVTLPSERTEREGVWEGALVRPDADSAARIGSVRFQLAVILTEGRIEPARFEAAPDQRLADVLSTIDLHFEPDRPITYARLDVTTADGDQLAVEADSRVQVIPDWAGWLSPVHQSVLTEDRVDRLVDVMSKLEDVDDVGEVLRCVTPDETP
jgi:2-methylcitrate dehydratase PrpD